MVATRISTLANHQLLLSNFTRVQSDLNDLQRQISSGRKASLFSELNGTVERVTGLENKLKNLTQFTENNTVVISRMQAMESSVGKVQELGDAVISLIIQSRSATQAQYPIFKQDMQNKLNQVAAMLNTNVAGRYLFAGSKTNIPPVENPVPQNILMGTPDSNYYQGDDVVQEVRAMEGLLLDYGVKADNQAFQELIASINTAMEGFTTNNQDLLEDALALANTAADSINAVRSRINGDIFTLQEANDLHSATSTFLKSSYGEVISTDVVIASTEVSLNESILQASFQSFSRTSSLRLADILR